MRKTSTPDFDKLDLGEVSVASQLSLEELEKMQQQTMQGAGRKGMEGVWYPGAGMSYLRLIPFWNPLRERYVRGKTSMGGWDVTYSFHLHVDFIPGTVIVCVRDTYGESSCEICETRFELGRNVFDGNFKHEFLKRAGVYTKTRGFSNILVIEDCGDEGNNQYPRPEYKPGEIYQAQLTVGALETLFAVLKDPDANEDAPVHSPINGRVLRYEITRNSRGYRDHAITVRPGEKWMGPLLPLPHPKKGYKGLKADEGAIKAAMKEAKDLTTILERPGEKELAAIHERAEQVIEEAKQVRGIGVRRGAMPPRESTGNALETGEEEKPATRSRKISGPTEEVTSKGERLCFGQHYQEANFICQVCDDAPDCQVESEGSQEEDDLDF